MFPEHAFTASILILKFIWMKNIVVCICHQHEGPDTKFDRYLLVATLHLYFTKTLKTPGGRTIIVEMAQVIYTKVIQKG
jgi:hypothetical protein